MQSSVQNTRFRLLKRALRLRAFRKNQNGATAVEFALVAPLFFGLLFAILETGTLFLRATAMDAGVEEAKRVTMTGQIASAGAGAAQESAFRKAFCDQVGWLISCSAVHFDVRAFSVFGAAAMPSPVSGGALNTAALQFNPGQPCQIVVIRAYYSTAALTALIRNDVATLNGGNVLLTGSAAFRNEPFGAC
jgi:Flp pilus assembly protein TadG